MARESLCIVARGQETGLIGHHSERLPVNGQLLEFRADIIHIGVPDLLGHAPLALAQQHGIARCEHHTRYEP